MDALFIIVAELLVVPLLLWGLIVFELTIGLVMSVVSVLLGRRSLTDMLMYRLRTIRRRLLWSLIYLSAGLLLADLVLFDAIVTLALGSADDREDLDVGFASAEGSFILGRIELHQLQLIGVRGPADDPSAAFSVTIDSLVIDIDTAALLRFDFAVEELAVDGVRGSFDRLRAVEPEQRRERPGPELEREFALERLHVGDMQLLLRDHTRTPARELAVQLDELDLGPLHSDSALFDLLYRARGRGSIDGLGFVLTATEHDGLAQTTLEVHDIPLDAIGEQLERTAGVRAHGHADVTVTNIYSGGPPEPNVTLGVNLQLRELELEAAGELSFATKLMLEAAERAIVRLGDQFPLAFEIVLLKSELTGMRSIAQAGIAERIADGVAKALQDELRRTGE